MAIFKMYDCDFGVTIKGTNYDFTHVESLQIEDPESTKLVRGSNAGNKIGLAFKEGLKEAKKITLTILGVDKAVHDLLKGVYETKERVDCYCISRVDGSGKIAKNAILSQSPKQLNMDDSAESANMALIFESFDVEEIHKT